jgi:hypothetical protein
MAPPSQRTDHHSTKVNGKGNNQIEIRIWDSEVANSNGVYSDLPETFDVPLWAL